MSLSRQLLNVKQVNVPNTVVARTDLGGVNLTYANFAISGVQPWATGNLYWNDSLKCLQYDLGETNQTLQVGQETVIRAKNVAGITLNNGIVVCIYGASSDRPTIGLLDASNLVEAKSIIGVVSTNIGIIDQAEGYVTLLGIAENLNTSSFAIGDEVYVNPTVAGYLTNVKPFGTQYVIKVGRVLKVDSSVGSIFVHPQYIGSALAESIIDSQTPNQITTLIEAVSLKGNQLISGVKTFWDDVVLGGNIRDIYNKLVLSVNTRILSDTSGAPSIDFNRKEMYNDFGYTSLNYNQQILSGEWKTNTAGSDGLSIINFSRLSGMSGALSNQINNFNQNFQNFSTDIQTGVDTLNIVYPFSFSGIPTVGTSISVSTDIIYGITIGDINQTGFTAYFSDTIYETGVKLNIIAKV